MTFRILIVFLMTTMSMHVSAKTVMAAISEYERRLTETGELSVEESKNLAKLYKLPMDSEAPANLLNCPTLMVFL
jgi:uncharacterized protein (DUF2384 family)